MTVKIKSAIKEKAQLLLNFADEQIRNGKSGPELFLTIFGIHGKARKVFSSKKDWQAFEQTDEIDEIHRRIEGTSDDGSPSSNANGHLALTLRLPKSVHAALLAEAAAEGVSLDQLCLSKLVAQLRELV